MTKKIVLSVILVLLAWGFWVSPSFKEVAAGVSIFLLGMLSIEEGFKAFTGGTLEKVLNVSTDNIWKSLGFGFVTTALMQSSSLVSLLTITFLSAGLINLAAGLGIIFGSNIGTTTGAWLIAGIGLKIDIAAYAMPIIVFGAILAFQSDKTLKGIGSVLTGIGFLFLGIAYTKSGFDTFQETLDLTQFAMTGVKGLLVYTLIGIVATVIMQSSHATIILGIAALAAGQISYENSLAIAIGSNVGTTLTAVLGSLGANVAGKRLGVAHLLFNVTMAIIALVFIVTLMRMVDGISSLLGIAADNYALKFAVFHTLFNVIGVVLMTPLIPFIVVFLEWLIPTRALDVSTPKYLNSASLALPDTALDAVINEVRHLYENVSSLIAAGIGVPQGAIETGNSVADGGSSLAAQEALDIDDLYQRHVKGLHGAIVEFATQAEQGMLPEQVRLVQDTRSVARDLVLATKDVKHLHKNMLLYLRSSNADIAAQYAQLRELIAAVLQQTDLVAKEIDVPAGTLEAMRQRVEQQDVLENGTLDQLIRDGKITPDMATSLINDAGYTQNICNRLLEAAEIALRDKEQKQALHPVRGVPSNDRSERATDMDADAPSVV